MSLLRYLNSEKYESTKAITTYLVFAPFFFIVFSELYKRIVLMLWGSDESADVWQVAESRNINTAPILSRLPPNFRFDNYVNEEGSMSADLPSSALSLNNAINIPQLLLPCPRCIDGKVRKQVAEVDLTIANDERPGSITRQTAKMQDVASWLASLDEGQGPENKPTAQVAPAVARGAPLVSESSGYENWVFTFAADKQKRQSSLPKGLVEVVTEV